MMTTTQRDMVGRLLMDLTGELPTVERLRTALLVLLWAERKACCGHEADARVACFDQAFKLLLEYYIEEA